MYEGVSKCVKRPLSDNTSNNMTNSRANIVETNMWPQHSPGSQKKKKKIYIYIYIYIDNNINEHKCCQ